MQGIDYTASSSSLEPAGQSRPVLLPVSSKYSSGARIAEGPCERRGSGERNDLLVASADGNYADLRDKPKGRRVPASGPERDS